MIMQFLSPRVGVVNKAIEALGGETVDFMGVPQYFRSLYVWSGVWQNAGWGTIIYLAALAAIDPNLHEAATVDGAGKFRRVLHIDIPGIMPTAVILLILNTGRIMNIGFEKVFLMQNPLNIRVSEIIATYVYKIGLASARADFSYAAAIGLFNAVINFALIVSVNRVARRFGDTSLW
jgi:ABC-type polysaccharide transport system permease subunit